MKHIFLDNASTTKIDKEVLNEMIKSFKYFGNPASTHCFGRKSIELVDNARITIAKYFNVKPTEIYFTSGGTEANNWIIKGIAKSYNNKGKHIITTAIEHSSILDSCKELESEGYRITYLKPDAYGFIDANELKNAITQDTILISIMWVNNELGTIQNIKELSNIAKQNNILFHTDFVAGLGYIDLDLTKFNIDLMSISAHKIHGPKGCGAIYIKKGTFIKNLIIGGNQESGKRAGTVNTQNIVGFGKAIEILNPLDRIEIAKMKNYLVEKMKKEIDNLVINSPENAVPNILNISIIGTNSINLVKLLDMKGIAVSIGSACTAGVENASYVLKALNIPDEVVNAGFRISLSKDNNYQELDYFVNQLKKLI